MPTLTWQELTERNKQALRTTLTGLDTEIRVELMALALRMVKDERFDSPSAKWNAFQNTLAILVAGLTTN